MYSIVASMSASRKRYVPVKQIREMVLDDRVNGQWDVSILVEASRAA